MAIASDFREKDKEIKAVWEKYPWFYPLLGGLLLLGIGFWLGMNWFAGDDGGLGYVTNLYTELLSIGITIVVLDRINQWRDERNLKKRLRWDIRSKSNDITTRAIETIRYEDWLSGRNGILRNADLYGTKLESADLWSANLMEAKLIGANLVGANLYDTKLELASLERANLQGANLEQANLEGTILSLANLDSTNLIGVNLEMANLMGATLPDGTIWNEGVDMAKFTDKKHPEYVNYWEQWRKSNKK